MENIAALAPIPSARDTMTTIETSGLARRARIALRKLDIRPVGWDGLP